jgi:hypothetical protein
MDPIILITKPDDRTSPDALSIHDELKVFDGITDRGTQEPATLTKKKQVIIKNNAKQLTRRNNL